MSIASFVAVSANSRMEVQGSPSIRDLKKLLMYLLESINALLKLDVVRWELSLSTKFQLR